MKEDFCETLQFGDVFDDFDELRVYCLWDALMRNRETRWRARDAGDQGRRRCFIECTRAGTSVKDKADCPWLLEATIDGDCSARIVEIQDKHNHPVEPPEILDTPVPTPNSAEIASLAKAMIKVR